MRNHLVRSALFLLSALAGNTALAQPHIADHLQLEGRFFDEGLLYPLQWRNIGPFRGGRVSAVTGIPGNPMVYFMGTAGGGIWKTQDAGQTWENCSDGFFKTASIGALTPAPSNPNIIYAGTGEHAIRGAMTSRGDGLYRSCDGGDHWEYLGLPDAHHIAAIQVHPQDPDHLYVGVQGAMYGPTEERGVYESKDGGITWTRLLFVNETTGVSDLVMHPDDPSVLYAATWDHQRTPWHIRSGGPGSGLYRSADGGRTWEKLTRGLPANLGKTGITICPSAPSILYAVLESKNGGVFRSTDGGDTWVQTSNDPITVGRAWYYTEIVAHPLDPETVFVLNAPLLQSTDGGKTFERIDDPHTDQHALWINPDYPQNWILGNDGGAAVTFNGGQSWSSLYNQPTGQFYRLTIDRQVPYRIYSAQQDHSSIGIASQTREAGITLRDWQDVGPGESGMIALLPEYPELVLAGSFFGNITAFDQHSGTIRDLTLYPELGFGQPVSALRYRFNWTAPLIADPLRPEVLYHAAQFVFRSSDQGATWRQISPDLTRNDPSRQGFGGGPFTNEGAGMEVYNTIAVLEPSPLDTGTLWAGSDDGLVHLTTDGGRRWSNVTPQGLPEGRITDIALSPDSSNWAVIAYSRRQFMEERPFLFRSLDRGRSWTAIHSNLPEELTVQAVSFDPEEPRMLFAGTSHGLFVSFDLGQAWYPFQLNLPFCEITDLQLHENDLIVSTAGRGIWILDDISALRWFARGALPAGLVLITPKDHYRFGAAPTTLPYGPSGQNPPMGVQIDYFLPDHSDPLSIRLNITDTAGQLVRTFTSEVLQPEGYEGGPPAEPALPHCPGFNRFSWDLRRPTLPGIPRVFIAGDYRGGIVPPGFYQLQLIAGTDTAVTHLTLLPDPSIQVPPGAYQEQAQLLIHNEDLIREIHLTVHQIREMKIRILRLITAMEVQDGYAHLTETGRQIVRKLSDWEKGVIQTRQRTDQDVINYPGKLNAELLNLKERIDGWDPRTTAGMRQRLTELQQAWTHEKRTLLRLLDQDMTQFNNLFREKKLPPINVPRISAY